MEHMPVVCHVGIVKSGQKILIMSALLLLYFLVIYNIQVACSEKLIGPDSFYSMAVFT